MTKPIKILLIIISLIAVASAITALTTKDNEGDNERRVEVLKSNKQGDPNANKYDFSQDGEDNNCGEGTVLKDGDCVPEALDDDSDGDSIPVEDEASDEVGIVNDENPLAVDSWLWVSTQYNNGEKITPNNPSQFNAIFTVDGEFSSETDCNNVSGSYSVKGNSITFGPLASTLKACPGETRESSYVSDLSEVQSYLITEAGQLVLLLKFDTGSMIFEPKDSETGTSASEATDYNSSRSNKNF